MDNKNVINASPTKEFFINMITRDISIDRAILDLIDNSVDAANKDPNQLKHKNIRICFNEKEFSIFDDCGGINLDDAKLYAFRFGRSNEDMRKTPNSVGQFGVGMKRTLFKLGRKFSIQTYSDSNFKIDVDVEEWKKEKEWSFTFEEFQSDHIKQGETLIRSFDLFDESVRDFRNSAFENGIKSEIEKAHFTAINKGLNIFVNGHRLGTYKIELKESNEIKPVRVERKIDGVTFIITAGIAERELEEGGWYIICNGRLIEESEQSSRTGWGNGMPKYHPDYAYFRGIVEFYSEDAGALPWTTTKTGVDIGHKIYRHALSEMRLVMKPILNVLKNRVQDAKNLEISLVDEAILEDAIASAPLKSFQEVECNEKFLSPEPLQKKTDQLLVSVKYEVSPDKIKKVQETIGKKMSNKQIGLATFDYYFKNECE